MKNPLSLRQAPAAAAILGMVLAASAALPGIAGADSVAPFTSVNGSTQITTSPGGTVNTRVSGFVPNDECRLMVRNSERGIMELGMFQTDGAGNGSSSVRNLSDAVYMVAVACYATNPIMNPYEVRVVIGDPPLVPVDIPTVPTPRELPRYIQPAPLPEGPPPSPSKPLYAQCEDLAERITNGYITDWLTQGIGTGLNISCAGIAGIQGDDHARARMLCKVVESVFDPFRLPPIGINVNRFAEDLGAPDNCAVPQGGSGGW
jgi:hypothetical protein